MNVIELCIGGAMQNIKKIAENKLANDIDLQILLNEVEAKQNLSRQERLENKENNKLEFTKKATDIVAYNKANTEFRSARVVNKVLQKVNLSLGEASLNIDNVENNLEEIKSILESANMGLSQDLDIDQMRINELVAEIQGIANSTEYKGKPLFNGEFELEVLDSISLETYNLNFEDEDSGINLDIFSTDEGTLGEDADLALADIAISEKVNSKSGLTGTVDINLVDDIDQMIQNLNEFRLILSREVKVLESKETVSNYLMKTSLDAYEIAESKIFGPDSEQVSNLLP